jgi:hypothetical protein
MQTYIYWVRYVHDSLFDRSIVSSHFFTCYMLKLRHLWRCLGPIFMVSDGWMLPSCKH